MRIRSAFAIAVSIAAVSLLAPATRGQACSANPIVCENQLAGRPSSEWDISGSGDGALQGFATEISVEKGDTVHFKVDTTYPTFNLTIYRLGYYGGMGARLIASQANLAGLDQQPCITQASTGLIDCGNWVESASWTVPSTAVSGIYVAKLSRTGSAGSHIVFVVRDTTAQADIVVQTSDTTWQAYNTYGGNSLYVGGPGTNPGRAYKVSYNRPITTRGTSPEDFVFNAEYPMVRWLEANGFNVSYMTGADTERLGVTELTRHKVFMAVGHDEYWSAGQRQNVEAARDAGVNLAFLTGNGIFWKTRWENGIDATAAPYRTLVSYKETHANAKIDPLPNVWTGTWRDTRFSPPADGGRPENAVMGTIFTVNWGGSGSESWAIEVPQTFASQPFWRNTRVATLASGAKATLAAGTLGYEWDENLNNGFRPAGLVTLSATTKSVPQKIQDFGSTYGPGTATHALTLYRNAAGNAWVFGAGTVQWSWGLDGNHDRGGSTPDLAMQQATVNLLYDMGGVQPGTLQANLVPGSGAPPPPPPPPPPAALAIDAVASGDRTTAGTTVTTAAFSTKGSSELLLAFVSGGWVSGSTTSVTGVTGGGLTWTRVTGSNTQRGTAEIWRARATTTLSNVTVTATLSPSVPSSITVVGFTGADTTGTNGSGAIGATNTANALSGAPSATVTTTRNNSWVFGVGDDTTASTGRTLGSNQTMVHQLTATAATDTYWVQRRTNPTATAGTSVRINDTAPTGDRYNLAVVEVLPALTPDTQAPAVSINAPNPGTTVSGTQVSLGATATDNVGVAGVQFLVDDVATGAEDTTNPFSIAWNSTAANNGPHRVTAVARDAAGNMATSAQVQFNVQNVVTPFAITAPTNGATIGNTVTITASTAGGFTAAGVQFAIDGTNVGVEDTTAPFSVTFTAPAGSHTLTAVARDAGGGTTAATPVSVTVSSSGTALTINAAQRFQTMDGLGVNMNALSWNNGQLQPAIDLLIDQLGASTFRVIFDMEDWETPNDNGDAATPDWTYFNALYGNAKFQNLWGTLHYLNQRGVSTGIVLSFMGRVPVWMGGSVVNTASEDEWAEMIATLVYYARNTEHVQFTLLDPLNETDNDGIEGPLVGATQYARLLNKLAVKLDAMSLSDVRFVGPNTASTSNGLGTYLTAMTSDPVVMAKVAHFGLHNYSASTGGADATIKASAYPGINFWMTEGGSTNDVLAFIGQNAASVQWWEAYDSVYNHAILHGQVSPGTCDVAPSCTSTPPNDNCCGTVGLIAYDTTTGVYTPRQVFYQQAQISRYVPPGSVRIGASQSNGSITIYAFHQASSGRITIVGRNTSASAITLNGTLSGLPAVSSLQLWQTTSTANFQAGNDAFVRSGAFAVVAPANSFFTLTTLAVPDTTPPTVSMTGPAEGTTVTGTTTVSANATDANGVAGVQFLLDDAPLGTEDTSAPFSIPWSPAAALNGPHTLKARARDLAGLTTTTAPAVNVTVNIDTSAPPPVTAPALDVTAFGDRSTSSTTISTNAFTTHSTNELLLAFVSADDVTAGNTVTGVSGGALTWQLVARTNAQRGDAEIWRAFAPGVLTNVTVTATLAQAAAASITVVTLSSVDTTGTNGSGAIGATRSAFAPSGAPTGTLTTTRNNSLVFGVGTDWDSNTPRSIGPNQTMVHFYLATVGDTYWVQRTTNPIASSGTSVTINDTAPTGDQYNLTLCEVLGKP